MPARFDFLGGPARRGPASRTNEPINPPGHWHDGGFEFAPGFGLADGQFVCPYGDHLVELEVDLADEENHFYEGFCDVCQRFVDIDYEPVDVIWAERRSEPGSLDKEKSQ